MGKAGEAALRSLLRTPHDADFNGLRQIVRPSRPLCLDVGANRGAAARSIRALWPDAQLICFEPLVPLAEGLQRRAGFPVQVKTVALSDRPGVFDLFVPDYNGLLFDGLASLDEAAASSWLGPDTIFGFRPDHLRLHRIACRAETLDHFDLAPFLLKIDVQGRELEVVMGGLDTILKHRPIVLAENEALDVGRLLELLAPADYRCFSFKDRAWRHGDADAANLYLISADKTALLRGLAA